MEKTFWAPKPDCEKGLNEEDQKFLENMKGSREGGISSLDRATLAKNKRKLENAAQKERRKQKEEQRKVDLEKPNITEQKDDSDNSIVDDAGDADFHLPETSKKRKMQEKRSAVNVNLAIDPTQWSKTVSLVADKHHISHRGLTELMSAVVSSGGGNINDLFLSKDTVRRHRNSLRQKRAESIIENQLETIRESESNRYLLHWDGKMLQNLEHVGGSKEVIAILLTATDTKSEILLKIETIDQGHSTADKLTKIILDTLEKCGIEKHLIIGLVFDTTSVNTGIHKGVTVCLERAFGNNLLQLACRHHVLELLCGAAASLVYSKTKSPNEAAFQVLLDRWPALDKLNFQLCKASCRREKTECENVVAFCQDALNDASRKDYQEVLELTVVFLGGELPNEKQFRMKAPGARHHARWMSKVIYTIKIAMFQHQLKNDIPACSLNKIEDLAKFLCLYYVKPWSNATLPFQSPIEDLDLYQKMLTNTEEHKSEGIRQISKVVASKFENHFWYLTERLVVLSLFSNASHQQKQSMAKALKKHKETPFKNNVLRMPTITQSTQLKDLFGPDSWLLFQLINETPVFLSKPASQWDKDKNYIHIKSQLLQLKVVNDSSERALGLVTEYHQNVVTKSQTQKQFLFQVVKSLREKQKSLLPKPNAERCTKRIMSEMW